jgi:hypothetical protein
MREEFASYSFLAVTVERLLSRLLEVLDRNDVVAAVGRLRHDYSL